jgi:hypothetical protein
VGLGKCSIQKPDHQRGDDFLYGEKYYPFSPSGISGMTAGTFAVAIRQTKAFSYRGNGRFTQWAFTDQTRLLFPVLLAFLNFTGKLQLFRGYERVPALYKHKIGKQLPFLYIFCNKKARKW